MELKISPSHINQFPLGGFLIKGESAKQWLLDLQKLDFAMQDIQVYPIPGNTANSIWGCFVLPKGKLTPGSVGRHELCQRVDTYYFIPEKTSVQPFLSKGDKEKLFENNIHLSHPEFGTVKLSTAINFKSFLSKPEEKSWYIFEPSPSVKVPDSIRGFKVHSIPPEEAIKQLEEKIVPEKKKLEDKPLTTWEKGKFSLYKALFKKGVKSDGTIGDTEKTDLMKRLESFFVKNADSDNENSWSNKMKKDFEDLDDRNQKTLDRLMNMFENDPEEALKYAIPLDHEGTTRGSANQGQWNLSQRRGDFSLFSISGPSSAGGSIDLGDGFHRLSDQYHKTARQLKEKGEYEKAAFVYLKLLKDNYLAASTLEEGRLYAEAATIYLKQLNNKERAAECYEKGNMIDQAIELYEELGKFEKVGDLYFNQNQLKEANESYDKAGEQMKSKGQYLEASRLYQTKMFDPIKCKTALLEGWRKNIQAYSCLKEYLEHFPENKKRMKEIELLYTEEVNDTNRESFLRIVQHEHSKNNELKEKMEEMAYQIIAQEISRKPAIVEQLRKFKLNDREIAKDTLRYRSKRKK